MGIILFFYGALIKPAFKLVFWVVVAYPLAIISSTLWSRWLSIPQLALIQPRMFGLTPGGMFPGNSADFLLRFNLFLRDQLARERRLKK